MAQAPSLMAPACPVTEVSTGSRRAAGSSPGKQVGGRWEAELDILSRGACSWVGGVGSSAAALLVRPAHRQCHRTSRARGALLGSVGGRGSLSPPTSLRRPPRSAEVPAAHPGRVPAWCPGDRDLYGLIFPYIWQFLWRLSAGNHGTDPMQDADRQRA